MDFMVFMAKMFVFFFPGVLTGLGLAHCRNRGQRNRRKDMNDVFNPRPFCGEKINWADIRRTDNGK